MDKILDKTGMKGTGKWTVQQAASAWRSRRVASSPDARFLSGFKDERVAAEKVTSKPASRPRTPAPLAHRRGEAAVRGRRPRRAVRVKDLLGAQGMNLIRAKSGAGLGPGPGRDGAHLEGRVHHPRALPRPHQAGVRQGRRAALAARGRRIRRRARGAQRRVAWGRHGAVNAGVATPSMSGSLACPRTGAGACPRTSCRRSALLRIAHVRAVGHGGVAPRVWSDMNSPGAITTSKYNNCGRRPRRRAKRRIGSSKRNRSTSTSTKAVSITLSRYEY